ncbi:MAG: DUF402 domain-containing protein [Dehalococcoidia bacterium]|nr:DUF402 domain-containing protein [Dehalococcoidia bacterium]
MTGTRVVEVKQRLDGRVERFDCELVERDRTRAVILFRIERPVFGLREAPLDSYGVFWRRRPYGCYHIVRPADGSPVVTRFDVVRDVELDAPGEVRYVDLLLDLRVERGAARWEDEAELAAAMRAGRIDASDHARVQRARRVLERGHVRITAEVRRLLRALGRLSG